MKISLRYKFIILTLSCMLFMGILILSSLQLTLAPFFIKELANRTIYIARQLAQQSTEPLLTKDTLKLQFILDNAKFQNKDIKYIFVLDGENRSFCDTFKGQNVPAGLLQANLLAAPDNYRTRTLILDKESRVIDVAVPVLDTQLGQLHLGISASVIDTARYTLRNNAASIIIPFIVLTGILLFILSRYIFLNPISKLSFGVKQISKGNLTKEIILNTGDELQELANAFNFMVGSVKTYHEDLEKGNTELTQVNKDFTVSNALLLEKTEELEKLKEGLLNTKANLEKMVDERTVSLKETNAMLQKEREAILNILEDLNQVNRQLRETQAKLIQSAKIAAVGELAGGVAHEINNPLTGVLNNVQLINMELAERKDLSVSEFKEVLAVIEESAMRCKKIIQALLDFSRVSKRVYRPVGINGLIEKTFILAEHDIILNNIRIIRDFSSGLAEVFAEANRLQQVFLDIFNNAKWALKDKKTGAELKVRTFASADKKSAVIEISDNGCGIEKENLRHMFEPFFTTKKPGEGTGLGLSVCYSIIKEHKGNIEAESDGKDKGATFRITLPVIIQ